MPELALTDIESFHDQLLVVEKSGLPLDLGFGERHESLGATLALVANRLTVEVTHGMRLSAAIESSSLLSPTYKAALWTWFHCDHSEVALDSITGTAFARQRVARCYQTALVHPLVLLCLAYFAMIFLSVFLVPKFESLYAQIGNAPGPALAVLLGIRSAMPFWIPIAPLALGATMSWWYVRRRRSHRRSLPGAHGYVRRIDHAAYAERVAHLLSNKLPLEQALLLAESLSENQKSLRTATEGRSFSPLLRWAIDDLSESENTSVAAVRQALTFRFVGHSYRRLAELQVTQLSSRLPALLALTLGGLFVSMVGLTVFLPLIEFMLYVAGGH